MIKFIVVTHQTFLLISSTYLVRLLNLLTPLIIVLKCLFLTTMSIIYGNIYIFFIYSIGSQSLSGDLQGQNYFHDSAKMLLASTSVLAFVQMV